MIGKVKVGVILLTFSLLFLLIYSSCSEPPSSAPQADIETLIARLDSEDAAERVEAAERLGEIADSQAVPALLEALEDSDADVRRAAAESIGLIGKPAVPLLLEALSDKNRLIPLAEYDNSQKAIIEPGDIFKPSGLPEHCVFCFFTEVFEKLRSEGKARVIQEANSASNGFRIYEINKGGKRIAVVYPGVGAPGAAAALDRMIALGCSKFIVCGGSGVLDPEVGLGDIVVPGSAVRDEGASYHYLPPSREVAAAPEGIAAIEKVLKEKGIDYRIAKTWTTDAIFRETKNKIKRRREEGCLVVEMEAAAFFAVAKFRGVVLAQILYGGDDISGDEWKHRGWNRQTEIRENLFWLAVESCLEM